MQMAGEESMTLKAPNISLYNLSLQTLENTVTLTVMCNTNIPNNAIQFIIKYSST